MNEKIAPPRAVEDSFAEVYRRERQGLVRLGVLFVGSQAVAEELVHDAFLRMHAQLDVVENPAGFLRTALVRLCLTWRRRHTMERERLELVDDPPPTGLPEIDETWDLVMALPRDRRVSRSSCASTRTGATSRSRPGWDVGSRRPARVSIAGSRP